MCRSLRHTSRGPLRLLIDDVTEVDDHVEELLADLLGSDEPFFTQSVELLGVEVMGRRPGQKKWRLRANAAPGPCASLGLRRRQRFDCSAS